jgi:hypothetical protein
MITTMAAAAGGAMIEASAFGQGISSRNLKPQPRGKLPTVRTMRITISAAFTGYFV